MRNLIYPAVFIKEEEGYSVSFPDLEGCFTQGETLEESFKNASEALALYLDGLDVLPVATSFENVNAESNQTVMLVEADDSTDIVYFKKADAPKFIKEGLEKKGFSKYQASKILGVDRSYLTYLEKGERVPSVDMAKKIATLLDFDWRVFYA